MATIACPSDHVPTLPQIDAGSTGSRMHIFKWQRRVFTTLPPSLTEPQNLDEHYHTNRTQVPLSNADFSGVQALKGLVAEVQQALSSESSRFSTFPIFLKATAGMRKLDVATREAILTHTRDYLASTGFMFKPEWARVISGEEEGIFGWLTVNYQRSTLLGPASEYIGALDLGGASTQITFSADVDVMANLFNLKLGSSVDADLYTHSFLYFGQNAATSRMNQAVVDAAVAAGKGGAPIDMPCLASGHTVEFADLYNPTLTYTLQGTSDFMGCRALAQSLLDLNGTCFTQPNFAFQDHQRTTCSIGGVYQPPLAGKFLAFSGYSHIWDFHKLPYKGATLLQLTSAAETSCAMDWTQLQAANPHVPVKFLQGYCTTSAYTVALWHDAYGVSLDSTAIEVADDEDEDVSWALGSMIYDANALTWSYNGPTGTDSREPYMTLFIVFLVVCLALGAVLGYKQFVAKRPRQQQGGRDMDYSAI